MHPLTMLILGRDPEHCRDRDSYSSWGYRFGSRRIFLGQSVFQRGVSVVRTPTRLVESFDKRARNRLYYWDQHSEPLWREWHRSWRDL